MTDRPSKQVPPAQDKGKKNIDREIEDSFPASDPPSYTGGDIIGEPPRPDKDSKK